MGEKRIISEDFVANLAKREYYKGSWCSNIVEKIHISGNLAINNLPNDNEIIAFHNCTFEDNCNFQIHNLSTIHFYNCNFKKDSTFGIRVSKDIFITNCKFDNKFSFSSNHANKIIISESIFQGDASIDWNTVSESHLYNASLTLESNKFLNKLFLSNNKVKGSITFRGLESYIKELIINDSNDYNFGMDGIIQIDDFIITGLLSDKKKYLISNIQTGKILLSRFFNDGEILFTNIIPKNDTNCSLRFFESDIGNSTFLKCDLNNFDVIYSSSNLSKIKIIGGTFPGPENFKKSDIDQDDFSLLQGLIQLKKIHESNGDFISATRFHEFELNLYQKLYNAGDSSKLIVSQLKKMYEQRGDSVNALKYQAKELEIHMDSPEISWSERWNLMFAYWSNNFGTDWIKALGFLFSGSFIFYLIFLFLQDYRFGNDWNLFGNIVANYFEFLNPLR
jgi:hypothetical protein